MLPRTPQHVVRISRDASARLGRLAEELFQEVSLSILKRERDGIVVENFPAWSREVARRTVLNHWKKKYRDKFVFGDAAMDALDQAFARKEAEAEPPAHGLLETLNACLKQLPANPARAG